MFFGQGDKDKVKKYVDEVFDKFDYDHSGELSYEGLHLTWFYGSFLTSVSLLPQVQNRTLSMHYCTVLITVFGVFIVETIY